MKTEEKEKDQVPSYLRETDELNWNPSEEFGGVSTREFIQSVEKVTNYVQGLTQEKNTESFAHFAVLAAIKTEEIRAEVTKMRQRVSELLEKSKDARGRNLPQAAQHVPRNVRRALKRKKK